MSGRALRPCRPPRARAGAAAALALVLLVSCAPRPTTREPLRLVPATAADLVALAGRPGARATLVNVWASWCVPCREEFPALLRLGRAGRDRGLRLLLVSTDFDSAAARAYLAGAGADGTAYFKIGDDMRFIETLSPHWSGALPATFVYDARGRLADWWEGKADSARFARAVRAAMDRGNDPPSREERR